ncbi:MAG: CNP1-like family protein [Burkholderiaceae bacterium]
MSFFAGLTASHAQLSSADPDWKEADVPPAPTFDAATLTRLVPFEVSIDSDLRWGIDPTSIQINNDGLVRYVVVARSQSGVINAFYESINCNKAEFKIHARHSGKGGWAIVERPDWRSMYDKAPPSKHALMLAKQGACMGNATAQNATLMMHSIKNTGAY